MTTKELHVLIKTGMIPCWLLAQWKGAKNSKEAMEYVKSNREMQLFYGFLFYIGSGYFTFWLGLIPSGEKFSLVSGPHHIVPFFLLMAIILILMGSVLWIFFGISSLGRDLEKLRFELELSWKELLTCHLREGFVETIDGKLRYQAASVSYAERLYGINSLAAATARQKFKQIHDICLRFGFAQEKYNPYYTNATEIEIADVDKNFLREIESGRAT